LPEFVFDIAEHGAGWFRNATYRPMPALRG
jgi:hypothetical protein